MNKVVVNFCGYFGDPENKRFIKKHLTANLVINRLINEKCEMYFVPPTASPSTKPAQKQISTRNLQLSGAMYGALITLATCGSLVVLYVLVRRYNAKRRTDYNIRLP